MSEAKQSQSAKDTPPDSNALTLNPSESASGLDVGEKTGSRVINSSSDIARRPVDSSSRNFEFQTESQQWVLLNLAHQQQKCKSDTAAFRVLGLFKTKEKATAHSQRMKSDMDIYILPSHSWFPITIGPVGTEEEAVAVQQKTVNRVESYVKRCADENKKVIDDANEDQAEERYQHALKKNKQKEALQKKLDDASEEGDDTVEAVPRQFEVRNQSYVVFSMVGEPDMDDEPCVNVLRAFDSKDDARDYLRNTIHTEEVVTDCFVAAMYEWITPCIVHTKKFFRAVEAHYSHSQLEEIHKGKRTDEKKIEKLLASRGKTMEDVDRFMENLEQEQVNDGESKTSAVEDEPTIEVMDE